jgi:hypothetical protein
MPTACSRCSVTGPMPALEGSLVSAATASVIWRTQRRMV